MTTIESIVSLSDAYVRVMAADRTLQYYAADELLKAINRLAKGIAPEPPKEVK